jgi:hypothetical protein
MDTSKEYIKMCERAEEIQEPHRKDWNDGDYYKEDRYDVEIKCGRCDGEFALSYEVEKREMNSIWLPHQDQLQEMIKYKYPKLEEMIYFFWAWMTRNAVVEIDGYSSLEQLWLAFVMWTLYQKTWNGEDWVK